MGNVCTSGPNEALVISGGCFSDNKRTIVGGWGWAWWCVTDVQRQIEICFDKILLFVFIKIMNVFHELEAATCTELVQALDFQHCQIVFDSIEH